MLFVMISFILAAPIWFNSFLLIIAALMLGEWYDMTKASTFHLLLGFIIIPPSIVSLILINLSDYKYYVLLYFACIWATDSLAMLGGKKLKGPKLAPSLSPNKTISGLIAGVIASIIMSIIIGKYENLNVDLVRLATIGLLIALLAQMSDLFISYFKRKFGIKDTGKLIPGHGGILDRFDSIILSAPILYGYILI